MQKKIPVCTKGYMYPYKDRHFHNALLELDHSTPLNNKTFVTAIVGIT